jgi:enoyl-CoA hydratase/carnithine racemase
MYFLPRRVGLARAKELVFTGRNLTAADALAIGMIERVARPEALLPEAEAWARELSAGSPAALALAKATMNQSFELPVEQVFAQGSQAQAICYSTREHQESVAAFLAKSEQRGRGA